MKHDFISLHLKQHTHKSKDKCISLTAAVKPITYIPTSQISNFIIIIVTEDTHLYIYDEQSPLEKCFAWVRICQSSKLRNHNSIGCSVRFECFAVQVVASVMNFAYT